MAVISICNRCGRKNAVANRQLWRYRANVGAWLDSKLVTKIPRRLLSVRLDKSRKKIMR